VCAAQQIDVHSNLEASSPPFQHQQQPEHTRRAPAAQSLRSGKKRRDEAENGGGEVSGLSNCGRPTHSSATGSSPASSLALSVDSGLLGGGGARPWTKLILECLKLHFCASYFDKGGSIYKHVHHTPLSHSAQLCLKNGLDSMCTIVQINHITGATMIAATRILLRWTCSLDISKMHEEYQPSQHMFLLHMDHQCSQ
jgi:hypothetical protein